MRVCVMARLVPKRPRNRKSKIQRQGGQWIHDDSSESEAELQQIEGDPNEFGGRFPRLKQPRFVLNSRGMRRLRRFQGSKPVAYRRVRASLMLYQTIPRSTFVKLCKEFGEETIRLVAEEISKEKENVEENAKRLARVRRNVRSQSEERSSSDDECVDDGGAFDRHMAALRNRMIQSGYIRRPVTPPPPSRLAQGLPPTETGRVYANDFLARTSARFGSFMKPPG